jgi:HlyD family secretion protein
MRTILIIIALAMLASCANTPAATPTPVAQSGPTAMPAVGGLLRAEGRVVPARRTSLSVPVGGVVSEVLVAEGGSVQAGQPLLRLERARAEATVAQAQADLQAAQASFEQQRAGATPEQIAAAEAAVAQAQAQLRQTQGGVTASDLAAAQAQLAQARAAQSSLQAGPADADLRQAQAQLAQAQAAAQTQRDGLSSAKAKAQSQIEQAANALRDRQADYSRIYWENRKLEGQPGDLPQAQKDQEAAALRAVQNAGQALAQAQLALTQAQEAEVSGVAAADAQVRDAQARLDKLQAPARSDQIAAARAQVAASQASLEKLRGDQRGGALDVAQAMVAQAEASLAQLRAGAAPSALSVATAQVQRAEAALALAKVSLDETELRAPFAGTIATITPSVGEYLAVGAPAVDLADLTAWQVETTDLTEQNIVRVRAGGKVSVTLDAIPDLELSGVVGRIRTLGESKQGDITYAVTIRLDQQDPRLRWNMTASVRFAEAP